MSTSRVGAAWALAAPGITAQQARLSKAQASQRRTFSPLDLNSSPVPQINRKSRFDHSD
jgi:hypothetical protein